MDATILDRRTENEATCFLVKIFLKDYVENLGVDYKDYEIQREIVTNTYLDNLIDTVLKKHHIPPIVLIVEKTVDSGTTLNVSSFKILDGLQRTYRLNAIWKTLLFFKSELTSNSGILELDRFNLSKNYSKILSQFDSSVKILQGIIKHYKQHRYDENFILLDSFENNYQWFEVWSGLSPEQEVSKMLVLNAGHKPVKIKHQLELIFRNIIPEFTKMGFNDIKIIREKEKSSIQFNKDRNVGDFHFSHIIASILSIKEGTPVTTNSAYIQKLQNSDFDGENDSKFFSFHFLQTFLKSLIFIDNRISKAYNDIGKRWMGREVTLVGIYGALGKSSKDDNSYFDSFRKLNNWIEGNIHFLNLTEFETSRNALELSKVNIGTVNKNAVYKAFSDILSNKELGVINWSKYFNSPEES